MRTPNINFLCRPSATRFRSSKISGLPLVYDGQDAVPDSQLKSHSSCWSGEYNGLTKPIRLADRSGCCRKAKGRVRLPYPFKPLWQVPTTTIWDRQVHDKYTTHGGLCYSLNLRIPPKGSQRISLPNDPPSEHTSRPSEHDKCRRQNR